MEAEMSSGESDDAATSRKARNRESLSEGGSSPGGDIVEGVRRPPRRRRSRRALWRSQIIVGI
jgi:hypothetical protein